MEKITVDFAEEMESLLAAHGFEEDEFAEGSGKTFKDAFQTVFFEDFADRQYLHVSSEGSDKEFVVRLPDDCPATKDLQRFIMDIIALLQEDEN